MSLKIHKTLHFSLPFSFLLKKGNSWEYNITLEIVSWKLALCLIFWSIFQPRIFLESRCHLPNSKFGEYLVTFSSGFKAALVGSGLKQAAFLHSPIWVLGQQSLSGSRVPRL